MSNNLPILFFHMLCVTLTLLIINANAVGEDRRSSNHRDAVLRPDTLYLPARAALAVNCMTRVYDETQKDRLFFYAFWNHEPPILYHSKWDFADGLGRITDALIFARTMSGSEYNIKKDDMIYGQLLSCLRSDGLAVSRTEPQKAHFIHGAALLGLNTLYLKDKSPIVRDKIKTMVARLYDIAIKKEDYLFYPCDTFIDDRWEFGNDYLAVSDRDNSIHTGWWWSLMLDGIMRYYEETHDPKALELCKKYINFLVYKSGQYGDDFGKNGYTYHFHGSVFTLRGILRYAVNVDNHELPQWVLQSYRKLYEKGSSFGWFPEVTDQKMPDMMTSESCCISDRKIGSALLTLSNLPKARLQPITPCSESWAASLELPTQMIFPAYIGVPA